MQVMLTEEDAKSLQKFIYELVTTEVEKAKRDASVNKRILNQTQIADYFEVSTTTIRQWETLGMPYGSMGSKSKFYDKEECRKWVLSQKR
ncbi:MerR family transcriptional regulator [Enterococcus dispar]|uniref:MerR family transcriptional regulator n=1 Tax=Enterococcus dispar TaxID=44009 RepID=UPI0018A01815|nr:MerR family transcriptional regulator [Enterococcus dispar]